MKSGENTNVFNILNTDAKLYLFSFLSKKDVGHVCLTNKENLQILDKPAFWQQRTLLDNHRNIPRNAYAKGIYLNNYQDTHIQKIVDMLYFTVGIDRAGHLHVLAESLKDGNEAMKRLKALTDFARNQQVLDIISSPGGTTYIRTMQGLFAFGSNLHGQQGQDGKKHSYDEIRLVQQSLPGKRILQADAGLDYSAVRTQDELILRGKISQKSKNVMKFRADNILDVKCGTRKAYVLKRNNVLFTIDDSGLQEVKDLAGKKVKEVHTNGGQTMVWCSDGLYLEVDGVFSKLPAFDDKTIYSVNIGVCHTVVHCKEGIYVSGMNNVGRLGTGDCLDRAEFTKIDLDQNDVTNMHLTSNSFIEMDGKWHMAGTFARTDEVDKLKKNFEQINFAPNRR